MIQKNRLDQKTMHLPLHLATMYCMYTSLHEELAGNTKDILFSVRTKAKETLQTSNTPY